MPFLSKSQRRKFYAMAANGEISYDTVHEWEKETKNKNLPDHVKKAMVMQFSKIATELFDPIKNPPIPATLIQKNTIDAETNNKRNGMTPIEYRNSLTSRRTGVLQKNREAAVVR